MAPAAQAAPTHASEPIPSLEGVFSTPVGVATDSEGNIYVAHNAFFSKIAIFSPTGVAITEFQAGFFAGPKNLAVDSSGNVYVVTASGAQKFKPSAFPPTGTTTYALDTAVNGTGTLTAEAIAIAVNPSDQNVYVAQPSKISIYQPDGTLVSATTGSGVAAASYTGVDVYGTNGNVYAADPAHNKAYIFKAGETTPLKEITGSEAPTGAFTGMEKPTVAVDQSNGNVLVSDIKGHNVVDEFNAAGKYVTQITHTPPLEEASPSSDIAVGGDGKVFINSGGIGGNVFVYGPIAPKFALTLGATGTGSISCDIGIGPEACLGEYVEGEKVTLTASPGVGSAFKEWTGACTGSGTCEVTMSAAKAVTAVFWKPHTLTVTPAGAGSGTVSADSGPISACSSGGGTCSGLYAEGTKVTLTATPAAHNKVAWAGCDATPTLNTCEVTIGTTDEAVTATFTEAPQRTLSLTVAGTGGSVSANSGTITACTSAGGANCSGSYFEGETITLTATPAAHKKVAWSGGCTATPSPNVCEVAIGASNVNVTATVTAIKRTLAITTAGSGAVKCNGVACLAEYDEGTSITLSAAPSAHWSFGGWSSATGSATCTGTGNCTFTLEADSSVTASFSAIKRSLTVNRTGEGSGSVSCNGGACAASYDEGSTVTLTASPAAGSTFGGWSGACTGAGGCVVTINADTVVTAKFDKASTPPPALSCVVPKLAGMKLSKAKSALTAAHCSAGKVTKPKPKKGKKQGALVVKSSKPSAGTTLAADAKVDLKLGPKPKKKKKG